MQETISHCAALAAAIAVNPKYSPDHVAISAKLARTVQECMDENGNTAWSTLGGSYTDIGTPLLTLAFDPTFDPDDIVAEFLRKACVFVCFDMDRPDDEDGSTFEAHFYLLMGLGDPKDPSVFHEALQRGIAAIRLPEARSTGACALQTLPTPVGLIGLDRVDGGDAPIYRISIDPHPGKAPKIRLEDQSYESEEAAKAALKALVVSRPVAA